MLAKFFRNPKIIIWLAFIVLALALLSPNPDPKGFLVTARENQSSIAVGEIVYRINGHDAMADDFAKYYGGIVQIETSKGSKFININGTLGIDVEKVAPTRLKFGLDIKGGVRAVLRPNSTDNATIEEVIDKLRSRINVYGLRETVLRPVYHNGVGFIEVSIAGGTKEELQNLIQSQGKFEAKIPLKLKASGGTVTVNLDKAYKLQVSGNSIIIDGKPAKMGDSFALGGIPFSVDDVSNNIVNLTSTVFTGDDVLVVYFDPQRSRIEQVSGGYQWRFAVQLSARAAQNFGWVTQNTNTLQGYLDSPIVFYLDSNRVDSLSISSTLKGRAETEISISGHAATKEEAARASRQLQSILKSGALPTAVEIVQLETISPTLGGEFLKNAILAGGVAILGVIFVVSARYRKPKLVLPMLAISLSEVLIVLGMSVLIGWTIDLAAIAGIIASVGTGIDSQIIILDRTLRREQEHLETLKEKMKKAFFVVFGSAGTVIAAMLPLLFLDILRGFAIVTILGVLAGVLIARPAYGAILEHLTKE